MWTRATERRRTAHYTLNNDPWAPAAGLHPQVPPLVPGRIHLRHRQRDRGTRRSVGAEIRHRRSRARRGCRQNPLLCRGPAGARRSRGCVPFPDAADHHRHLTRHRVRPPQRFLRAPAAARSRVLSAPPHRRSHVAGDQRPQRSPHDDRSSHHVLRHDRAHVYRGDRPHALDRCVADAVRPRAAAPRLRVRRVLWGHPSTGGSSVSRSSCPRSAR